METVMINVDCENINLKPENVIMNISTRIFLIKEKLYKTRNVKYIWFWLHMYIFLVNSYKYIGKNELAINIFHIVSKPRLTLIDHPLHEV